jgi:hypothetical protein
MPIVAQISKYQQRFLYVISLTSLVEYITASNALLIALFETKPHHTLQTIHNKAGHKMEEEITDIAILCFNIG